jgi:hypothetical protein
VQKRALLLLVLLFKGILSTGLGRFLLMPPLWSDEISQVTLGITEHAYHFPLQDNCMQSWVCKRLFRVPLNIGPVRPQVLGACSCVGSYFAMCEDY